MVYSCSKLMVVVLVCAASELDALNLGSAPREKVRGSALQISAGLSGDTTSLRDADEAVFVSSSAANTSSENESGW